MRMRGGLTAKSSLGGARTALAQAAWIVRAFGIDPTATIRACAALPWFIKGRRRYSELDPSAEMSTFPCFHDRNAAGGDSSGEYFWLDLHVAQIVANRAPARHADIGSRIDGFVAHLAAFRPVEVFDIRPIEGAIPNVTFHRADAMSGLVDWAGQFDSVSCLHALEHFGLGRYGDPLDAGGHWSGLRNVANLARAGASIFIGVPSGVSHVFFNAHRVISPRELVARAQSEGLEIVSIATVDVEGVHTAPDVESEIDRISQLRYVLALYEFRRL